MKNMQHIQVPSTRVWKMSRTCSMKWAGTRRTSGISQVGSVSLCRGLEVCAASAVPLLEYSGVKGNTRFDTSVSLKYPEAKVLSTRKVKRVWIPVSFHSMHEVADVRCRDLFVRMEEDRDKNFVLACEAIMIRAVRGKSTNLSEFYSINYRLYSEIWTFSSDYITS